MTALSITIYNGDGATTDFAFAFPYLLQAHVHVLVDGAVGNFTFVNAQTVRVSPAPPVGSANVRVYRSTSVTSRLVTFTDGSALNEQALDTSALQSFYFSQELLDDLTETTTNLTAAYTSLASQITTFQDQLDDLQAGQVATNTGFSAGIAALQTALATTNSGFTTGINALQAEIDALQTQVNTIQTPITFSGVVTGPTLTLDLTTNRVRQVILGGNLALSFSTSTAAGTYVSAVIELTQDATGGRTLTWPQANLFWPSTAPTLTTTAGVVHIIRVQTFDAGTTWYADLIR